MIGTSPRPRAAAHRPQLLAIRLALATVAVLSVFAVEIEGAALAGATNFPVHHQNICGNACGTSGSDEQADDVISQVNAQTNPQVLVLTLNEVCWSQFERIKDNVYSFLGGGNDWFSTTKAANLMPGGCGNFGNAVVAAGDSAYWDVGEYQFSAQTTPSCSIYSAECRRVMCVK